MGSCMVKYAGLLQFKGQTTLVFKDRRMEQQFKCVGINVESN